MRKLSVIFVILALGVVFWPRPATAGDQFPTSPGGERIAAAPTRVAGQPSLSPPVEPPQQPPSSEPAGFLTGPNRGDPLDIALNYLRNNAAGLRLTGGDLADVVVTDRYTSKHNGVTHIYLRQRLNGFEIYGANLNINISRDGRVISLGHRFIPEARAAASAAKPGLSPLEAVEQAARQLGLEPTGLALRQNSRGVAQATVFAGGDLSQEDIPVKLVYQPTAGGSLRLAWDMSIYPPDGLHWWSLRVDSETGRILSQVDWSADDTYTVYPLPMESPDEGPRVVVSNPAAANPVASPYGWHDTNGAPGPEFTVTRGNNVSAQDDIANDNNTTLGFQPDGGPGLVFSTTIDLNLQPTAYMSASIINLFYWNNILHDVLYQYGFDEASGNFQQNSYGRGGLGNDPVQADALDGSGTNNANFFTPPDGQLPRMQMYLWADPASNHFQVNSPPAIAGNYSVRKAEFSPFQGTITASVKLADDGVGTVTDGCEAFVSGFFSGLIALIDRGDCQFDEKAKNAQDAGAVGVIIANNMPGAAPGMAGDDSSITIPVISLSQTDGNLLKGQLPAPGVNATIILPPGRDSSLDNGIIAHEYGHGLSTRLTGGPSNSNCLNTDEARGMGEGWSDFLALVLTARPGETGPQARGIGNYAFFQPPTGLGIRRYPYSTDMSVNPLTLADMPDTNGVVHNIGEIWNSMLWEVYWKLVDRYGFDPDLYNGNGGNNRALQAVIDGLKFQPCSPSLTEARDAILLADLINSNSGVNQCAIWEGFAKRGLGANADTGDPYDEDDDTADFGLPGFCTNTLVLNKSASPDPAQAGGVLTYTLVAQSFLSTTVTGVVLADILPLSTSYIAGSASHGGSLNSNKIQWAIGTMAPNAVVTRTFRVRASAGLNRANIFLDDVENGAGRWVASHAAGSFDWALTPGQPFEGLNKWFAADPAEIGDQYLTLANPITLPANQVLSFWHYYNTETGWDGGVVEISTNGGSSWSDLAPHIIKNGYNSTIFAGSQSPIENRPAFSGDSGRYLQTVVNLSSYSGQSVLIRFRMASDEAAGGVGWSIDYIWLGPLPSPELVNEAVITGNGLSPVTATATTGVLNTPLLTYSPAQVAAVLSSNQQVTQTLTLSNPGGRDLSFSLAENAPWLTVSPLAGTVPPFSSTKISLVFNSAVVSPAGTYTSALTFNGNMINGPITPLPVQLTVGGFKFFFPVISKN